MLSFIGNQSTGDFILLLIVLIGILPVWLIVEIIRYLRRH